MNQILFIQDKTRSNPQDTKKIVLFFAITLIVFGLILSGQGVYAMYQNHADQQLQQPKIGSGSATIDLTQTEDSSVQITVNSNTVIADLIYTWEGQAAQTIAGNGQTTMQETIALPVGTNTLTVKVIDVDGNQSIQTGTYTLSADKPDIRLFLVGNTKIKISVTSNVDLANITYKWNSEQEQSIDMTPYTDKKIFEQEIDIPTGQNTLVVTATDVNNLSSDRSLNTEGKKLPEIKPVIQGDYLYFEVTADEVIKQVDFEFNGQAYVIKSDVIGNSKKATYRVQLKKGMNHLKIKATTESDVTAENMWKYELK